MASTLELITHTLRTLELVSSPTSVESVIAALTAMFTADPDWDIEDSGDNFVRLQSKSTSTPNLQVIFAGDDTTPPQSGAIDTTCSRDNAEALELYVAVSPDAGGGTPSADPWAQSSASAIWGGERGTGWISVVEGPLNIIEVQAVASNERIVLGCKSNVNTYFMCDVGAIVAALDDAQAESDKRIYGVATSPSIPMYTWVQSDFNSGYNFYDIWGRGYNGTNPNPGYSVFHVFEPTSPATTILAWQPLALMPYQWTAAADWSDKDGRHSHIRLPLFRCGGTKQMLGYWRQMTFGPRASMFDELAVSGTTKTFALAANKTGTHEAIWVDNFIS